MGRKYKIVALLYFTVAATIVLANDNVKMFATALDYIACGSAKGIPKPVPQIITIGYTLLMVGAPIVLIVSSLMTLVKAVAESNQEKMLKARNVLVRKAIMAFLIFLTASIVRFVASKVASTAEDKNTIAKCLNCFIYYNTDDCQPSEGGRHYDGESKKEDYIDVGTYTGGATPRGEKTILIGDSRTVGICGSTSRSVVTDCRDGVLAVRQGAASNQGGCPLCNWFDNEAVPAVNSYLNSHSSTIFNIVILMGVNDLGLTAEQASDNYINDLKTLSEGSWKNHSIVFVSTGPVKDEDTYVGQSKIDEFNKLMGEKIKKNNFHNVMYCDITDKVNWVYGTPGAPGDGIHYYGKWIDGHFEGSTNYFNGVMNNCGLRK